MASRRNSSSEMTSVGEVAAQVSGVTVGTMPPSPGRVRVFEAIRGVLADIAAVGGIAKTHTNERFAYKFRSIDDLVNLLAPLLAKHGLLIIPSVVERELVERRTADGKTALYHATVRVELTFVAVEDGSQWVCTAYGEGIDTTDKATNKALIAAYKYGLLLAFCVPVGEDADAGGVEAAAPSPPAPPARASGGPRVDHGGGPPTYLGRDAEDPSVAVWRTTINRSDRKELPSGTVKYSFKVETGDWVGTFDPNLAAAAAWYEGKRATLRVRRSRDGRFWDLVGVEPPPAAEPIPGVDDVDDDRIPF